MVLQLQQTSCTVSLVLCRLTFLQSWQGQQELCDKDRVLPLKFSGDHDPHGGHMPEIYIMIHNSKMTVLKYQ